MQFGPLPLSACEGCLLAHSLMAGKTRLRKGHRLTAADLETLGRAGYERLTVLRLDENDLLEDAAATAVAAVVSGAGLEPSVAATGRVNLYAGAEGLLTYDRSRLDAVNRIDEAVTLSALPPGERVEAGQLVATVKIIPLAVEATTIERLRVAVDQPVLNLAAFRPTTVGLLQTQLPGVGEKLLEKTRSVTAAKLGQLGSRLVAERVVAHDPEAIRAGLEALLEEGCELLLVLGASATTDRRDVIPAAITTAGGRIERFGMPVDPGNLLVLAELKGRPVILLPGSARSPKVGGNDWVLWRLLASQNVTSDEIAGMGAGGLLKENPARPLPRVAAAPRRRGGREGAKPGAIGAVVLAAGRSSRMGADHKLLAELGGKSVIARSLEALTASQVHSVVVVTGARAQEVEAELPEGGALIRVRNPDYAEGMAGSLARGIAALPREVEGVLVVLGDMPLVECATLNALIAAFDPDLDRTICLPCYRGKRGHPVLFARRFFPELAALSGDRGARDLLIEHAESVFELPVEDEGVILDLDTPEALEAARRRLAAQDSQAQK